KLKVLHVVASVDLHNPRQINGSRHQCVAVALGPTSATVIIILIIIAIIDSEAILRSEHREGGREEHVGRLTVAYVPLASILEDTLLPGAIARIPMSIRAGPTLTLSMETVLLALPSKIDRVPMANWRGAGANLEFLMVMLSPPVCVRVPPT